MIKGLQHMTITLEFVSTLPDPEAFETLMRDYYQIMLGKLLAVGGPDLSSAELAADTMAHIGDLAPPDGRILLAHAEDGTLVGCGVLRKIRDDAVEMKRMYVHPDMQGHGVGRRLFEMRIDEARRMGCRAIYADTVKGNTAMLAMYERFGFSYISRYPENANPPELEPFLVFLRYDIA
jgi:GNAT superfamily N-acetyltransferase